MAFVVPKELLQCAICLGQQKTPRTLPCLHSYCEDCLRQHISIAQQNHNLQRDLELGQDFPDNSQPLDSHRNQSSSPRNSVYRPSFHEADRDHRNGSPTGALHRIRLHLNDLQLTSRIIRQRSRLSLGTVATPSPPQGTRPNVSRYRRYSWNLSQFPSEDNQESPTEESDSDDNFDSDVNRFHGFPCPTCRTHTVLPEKGVLGFPKDFRIQELIDVQDKINSNLNKGDNFVCGACKQETCENCIFCVDCQRHLCDTCFQQHNLKPVLASHLTVPMETLKRETTPGSRCLIHKKELVKYYCQDCQQNLCLLCTLHSHDDHRVKNLEQSVQTYRGEVKNCLQHLREQTWALQDVMFALTVMEGQIKGRFEEQKLKVRRNARHLTNQIAEQEFHLLRDLEKAYMAQSQEVYQRRETCRGHLQQFQTLQTRLDGILQVQDTAQVANNYEAILKDIQRVQITSSYRKRLLDLGTRLTYVPSHNTSVVNLGSIQFTSADYSPNSNLPGRDPESITPSLSPSSPHNGAGTMPNQLSSYINDALTAFNSLTPNNVPLGSNSMTRSPVRTQNTPDSGISSENLDADTSLNSNYHLPSLSTGAVPCLKLLYIVGGNDSSSPLHLPHSATFDLQGHLVVAENAANRLQIFNQHGHSIKILPLGKCVPRSVACTGHGNIVFTDEESKGVKMLTQNRRVLCSLNQTGHSFPFGIVALSDGRVAVSDIVYENISLFDPSGKLERQFGSVGTQGEFLINPTHLATDHFGNILVSDSGHHEVKVYDPRGHFMYKFGRYGSGNDSMRYPKGLACDINGIVYVADSRNDRVLAFSDIGVYLGVVANRNQGIQHPVGLAYCPTGKLAVTMPDLNKVAVFELTPSITA